MHREQQQTSSFGNWVSRNKTVVAALVAVAVYAVVVLATGSLTTEANFAVWLWSVLN
jgi:hypothetical protein